MDQPPPTPDPNRRPVWDALYDRMQDRDALGFRKYGVRLRAFDGRRTLEDAIDEALDLAVYLEKERQERGELEARVAALEAACRAAIELTERWARPTDDEGYRFSSKVTSMCYAALLSRQAGRANETPPVP